jgi:HPt (histidine-containing phosphotransfer) domain-containing protein
MTMVDPAPKVFDCGAVRSMTGHAGDREFARVFVSRYRQLLPLRVRRILGALHDGDLEEAMDAVLSLKTSSSTAGTGELVELGSRIERHLRQTDLTGAALVAEELECAARRAHRALTAFLGG